MFWINKRQLLEIIKRRDFLIEFLGALGAENIKWQDENDHFISGIVIYDSNNPEETQEFYWHVTEREAPGIQVLELAKLLRKNSFLSIDQIKIQEKS